MPDASSPVTAEQLIAEPSQARPHIVIVGGGFAGFWAAAAARRVGGDQLDITMVSAGPSLQIRPRLYEADPASLGVDLQPFLDTLDVAFVIDTAIGLDPPGETSGQSAVLGSGNRLPFDRLVVATGSVMARPPIVGAHTAHCVDTQQDAVAFDAHLQLLAENSAAVDATPIAVAVIGAGFTGIELALELRDRVAAHGAASAAEAMRIVLIDRADTVGSELGPNPRGLIESALAEAGVETRLNANITQLSAQSVTFADGNVLRCDAVVLNTGLRAAPFVAEVPGERDSLGRLNVDPTLRAPRAPHVFVTGDAAAADTGDGHITLQSCQHALQTGRVAGENAARDALGLDLIQYQQLRYVTCLDLGRFGAVLTGGWDRQVLKSGAEAKALKRRINTETIYPPSGATKKTLLEMSLFARPTQ